MPTAASNVPVKRQRCKTGQKAYCSSGSPLSNLPARWPTKDGFYVAKVTDKAAKELLTKKQMEANVAIDLSTEHTFNVVAKIEAPKANNPEGDVLILGAHYDHMGIEENMKANPPFSTVRTITLRAPQASWNWPVTSAIAATS